MANNKILLDAVSENKLTLSEKYILLNMVLEYAELSSEDEDFTTLCFNLLDEVEKNIVKEYIDSHHNQVTSNMPRLDQIFESIKG